jgi:hypothetical protein
MKLNFIFILYFNLNIDPMVETKIDSKDLKIPPLMHNRYP